MLHATFNLFAQEEIIVKLVLGLVLATFVATCVLTPIAYGYGLVTIVGTLLIGGLVADGIITAWTKTVPWDI